MMAGMAADDAKALTRHCPEPTRPEVLLLAACGEPATQPGPELVWKVLPTSASIIEAFRDPAGGVDPGLRVLTTARELAAHHRRQWHAEDASRAPGASAVDIAACKRLIDELNARRVALVEQIDEWVGNQIRSDADASLHTETLGSVVDRLAIAWVRANSLTRSDAGRDDAGLALRQLAELADGYDVLASDVASGRRRLPAWRSLKTYRSKA